MDESKILVLIDGIDKTSEIAEINDFPQTLTIRFHNNDRIYPYKKKSRVLRYEDPKLISPDSCRISSSEENLYDVVKILDFGPYLKIFYGKNRTFTSLKNKLRIEHNALQQGDIKQGFTYLKSLAKSIKSEENDFLDKQYEQLEHLSPNSVLAKYLNQDAIENHPKSNINIFPFGLNLSQDAAVANALTHQVSITEGPPGTGKTQTILNIIANLLMEDKTVAIVSNNNAAIQNVYDKLDAYDLSFFAVMLGKRDNKDRFFNNQQEHYPENCTTWKSETPENRMMLKKSIVQIKELLKAHNDLATALQELDGIQTEQKHFEKLFDAMTDRIEKRPHISKLSLDKTLSFWAEADSLLLRGKNVSLLFKIKTFFKYGINPFSLYSHSLNTIILFLQKRYYEAKEEVLQKTISDLENRLTDAHYDTMVAQYSNDSMALLKHHLAKKYDLNGPRTQFGPDALWRDFESFIREYPVILSTTHSLRNSTQKNFLYDYLIVDEASQVDIVAGGLAMSCAKNIVIVGDLKQLPHIVGKEIEEVVEGVFHQSSLSMAYHYRNSLLASAASVFKDAPKTLLKEHYRCHPKIIEFCNKKFYDDQLVIMSKADNAVQPLVLVNTAEGDHTRGRSNQRQIDVIQGEILPSLKGVDLGIVSPFREQVERLSKHVGTGSDIEIDTVHKYQGREKKVMIITTVVDQENEFADDPNLLNVAISRAKDQLYIVVSDREKNKNMKDLVAYIRYNNFDITESKIYSIFDLMYQSYAPYLQRYLGKIKNISAFESENLMSTVIEEVLSLGQYTYLTYTFNYPLQKLIRNTSGLDEKELAFVQASSHVDFLIYNKISKQPVLALEVDGVTYHANNPEQLKRDALKDNILTKYRIPIMRFATDGSEEKKKLLQKLKELTGD